MNPKIVAFINFKGGVGKTSNAVNIGACLARNHKKKVLIVDLDAQCNSSFWLLNHKQRELLLQQPNRTTYQIFKDKLMGTSNFDFEESVIRGVPINFLGNPQLPFLDLLPAAVELLEVEEHMSKKATLPYFTWLEKALKPHAKEYDYVLLDCPPNIYTVSKNALFFADTYLIPYIPDYLSLSGFRVFSRLVRTFQDEVSGYKPALVKPRVGGVIVNRYQNSGNVFSEGINTLKLELMDLKASKLVNAKAIILDPPIRSCVKVAECSNHHLPVIVYNDKCNGSEDYSALTVNFIKHLEEIL